MNDENGAAAVLATADIVLVDDHPVVRDGLKLRLAKEADLNVVGEAAEADEALRLVTELAPQLVIVDISLAKGSGLELIKEIHGRFPDVKSLVFSMHAETLYADRALRAGALGYVHKRESVDTVVEAIHDVLQGKTYLSAAMADRRPDASEGRVPKVGQNPVGSLSDRELEVLSLMGGGMATREIAKRLQLSVHTIETYREKIKLKLNLKDAAELWRFAVQWALERQ